jgi:hypothetical protein
VASEFCLVAKPETKNMNEELLTKHRANHSIRLHDTYRIGPLNGENSENSNRISGGTSLWTFFVGVVVHFYKVHRRQLVFDLVCDSSIMKYSWGPLTLSTPHPENQSNDFGAAAWAAFPIY